MAGYHLFFSRCDGAGHGKHTKKRAGIEEALRGGESGRNRAIGRAWGRPSMRCAPVPVAR
jgi:hypothetical protein